MIKKKNNPYTYMMKKPDLVNSYKFSCDSTVEAINKHKHIKFLYEKLTIPLRRTHFLDHPSSAKDHHPL